MLNAVEILILIGATPEWLLPSIRTGPLQLTITFNTASTCGIHVVLFCENPHLATISKEGKATLSS